MINKKAKPKINTSLWVDVWMNTHRIRFLMASLKYAGIDDDFKLTFPVNYKMRKIERS